MEQVKRFKRGLFFALALGAIALPSFAQQTVAWKATTGSVSLSGSATAATIQQVAATAGAGIAYIDKITVYCSVACAISQAYGGTAATATAGTINPLAPSPPNSVIPLTFWTASNVGSGTDQGGITEVPAGGTVTLCLSPSCGNNTQVILPQSGGTGANYTISIASITGNAIITFFGRSQF
jgi:hypothetical protein